MGPVLAHRLVDYLRLRGIPAASSDPQARKRLRRILVSSRRFLMPKTSQIVSAWVAVGSSCSHHLATADPLDLGDVPRLAPPLYLRIANLPNEGQVQMARTPATRVQHCAEQGQPSKIFEAATVRPSARRVPNKRSDLPSLEKQ
jgi:hypothetical protein